MTEHAPHVFDRHAAAVAPVRCLIIPGLNGSGPNHWQTRWQECRNDCVRVELGDWESPTRTGWIDAIESSVTHSAAQVVLVGHSLGSLAIMWWAARASPAQQAKVVGAMLVAPPDVGQQGCDLRLLRFAPLPPGPLPFPALLVASANDPYASLARARRMAQDLGATFVDIGEAGHINAASSLDDWPQGQALLAYLIGNPTNGRMA